MDLFAELALKMKLTKSDSGLCVDKTGESVTKTREIIAESRELIRQSEALLHEVPPSAGRLADEP